MKNTEKFMTDQEFKGHVYEFIVYGCKRDKDRHENGQVVLMWHNNNLTREEGQLVLMGMCSGASCKYKHPYSVLYAVDCVGNKKILSSCMY